MFLFVDVDKLVYPLHFFILLLFLIKILKDLNSLSGPIHLDPYLDLPLHGPPLPPRRQLAADFQGLVGLVVADLIDQLAHYLLLRRQLALYLVDVGLETDFELELEFLEELVLVFFDFFGGDASVKRPTFFLIFYPIDHFLYILIPSLHRHLHQYALRGLIDLQLLEKGIELLVAEGVFEFF